MSFPPMFPLKINPTFSFYTLLNNDILNTNEIHFFFHSLTSELSQSGLVAHGHFRASLPWFIISSPTCGFYSL